MIPFQVHPQIVLLAVAEIVPVVMNNDRRTWIRLVSRGCNDNVAITTTTVAGTTTTAIAVVIVTTIVAIIITTATATNRQQHRRSEKCVL